MECNVVPDLGCWRYFIICVGSYRQPPVNARTLWVADIVTDE